MIGSYLRPRWRVGFHHSSQAERVNRQVEISTFNSLNGQARGPGGMGLENTQSIRKRLHPATGSPILLAFD